jgi:sec-independent protein translocase protein TatA
MFGLGTQELLVILVIVLVLFGANRLPELARSLGSSVKEFKKGVNEAATARTESTADERQCGHCTNPLAADWTHCPRCGTAVTTAPSGSRPGQGL